MICVRMVVYVFDGSCWIGFDVMEVLNGEYICWNGSGNGVDVVDGVDLMYVVCEFGFVVVCWLFD